MENLVVSLTEIVAKEIAENVAIGVQDADTYFLRDDAKKTYSFISVPRNHPQKALIVLLARVTNDSVVIIETDHTNRPLYKDLIELGVPRNKIIRAYAGKTEPEP